MTESIGIVDVRPVTIKSTIIKYCWAFIFGDIHRDLIANSAI